MLVVIGSLLMAGYLACFVVGGVMALFMTPVLKEYDADGKIDREWRWVNKGRWT